MARHADHACEAAQVWKRSFSHRQRRRHKRPRAPKMGTGLVRDGLDSRDVLRGDLAQ